MYYMYWDKKKIIVIAGISTLVLALGLGLGLGLGLKKTESETTSTIVPPLVESDVQYSTATGIVVNARDIENQKVMIDQMECEITKEGESLYLSIPSSTYSLSGKQVWTKNMFNNIGGRVYDKSTVKGEGKDNFYDLNHLLPSLAIGIVRIPNDGKIYGGYVGNSIGTGYVMNSKLAALYPNGYQIGDFNRDGKGGINMLMLQQLKTLISASSLTAENVDDIISSAPTTTKFGPFLYAEYTEGRTYIRLATNPAPATPAEIGYVSPNPDTFITYFPFAGPRQPYWYDEQTSPEWDGTSEREQDYQFKIREFVHKDGTPHTITLSKDATTMAGAVVDVPLNTLYMPLTFVQGQYQHPVLGMIQPDVNGNVKFDYSIKDANGNQPTFHVNDDGSLSLPTLLLPLQKN